MEELMEVLTMCENLSKKMKQLELSGKIRMGVSFDSMLVREKLDAFVEAYKTNDPPKIHKMNVG